MDYEILVNRDNKICDNEINLIIVYTRIKPTLEKDSNIYLEKTTYTKWLELKMEAQINGFDFDIVSGYRTKEYQQKVLEYYIEKLGFETAISKVAIPNYSEHQTGLAIDYCYFRDNKEVEKIDFEDEEFTWIKKNMHVYGFILRYPEDKIDITGYVYEPWHIRYVGVDLALHLYNNNLTLEEYQQKKLLM